MRVLNIKFIEIGIKHPRNHLQTSDYLGFSAKASTRPSEWVIRKPDTASKIFRHIWLLDHSKYQLPIWAN